MKTEPTSDDKLDLSPKGSWHQLPNESAKAYGAFTKYLDLGQGCPLKEVAAQTGLSLSSVWNLSSRYQWSARAYALRQHFAAITCQALDKATEKATELWAARQQLLREQDWECSQSLNAFCQQAIHQHLSKSEVEAEPYEIRGLMQLASKLGHQATAPDPSQGENPLDRKNDPLVRMLQDHVAKALAASKPQITTPEPLSPTEPPAP